MADDKYTTPETNVNEINAKAFITYSLLRLDRKDGKGGVVYGT